MMRKLTSRFVRYAAATATLILAAAAPLPSDGVVVANGGTTIDFFGSQRTMAFTVVENPVSGEVSGQLQLNNPDAGQSIHVNVESYYDTGTDLIVVGPVTHSVNGPPVGSYLITSVRDGGNGGSSDTITFANSFGFPFTAEDIVLNGPPLDVIINQILGGYHPLTDGNVTIH